MPASSRRVLAGAAVLVGLATWGCRDEDRAIAEPHVPDHGGAVVPLDVGGLPAETGAFSIAGQQLAVAAGPGLAFGRDGKLARTFEGHDSAVTAVAWAPDNQRIAMGAVDGTVRVWGRSPIAVRRLPSEGGAVRDVSWSPDGTRLATVEGSGVLVMRDHLDPGVLSTFVAADHDVRACVWSPDSGRHVATQDGGGALLFVGDELAGVLPGQARAPVAWSPDGARVAVGGAVYDGATGALLRDLSAGSVSAVAFSPDGATLLTAGATARTWDVATGTPRLELGPAVDAAFRPDGQRIATAGADGVHVWHAVGGELWSETTGAADALAWSPDGALLAIFSRTGPPRIWDVTELR